MPFQIGNKLGQKFKRDHIPWNRNKTISDAQKKDISKTLKNYFIQHPEAVQKLSIIRKGSKNWNWKGGISSLNKRIRQGLNFRIWHSLVLQHDNWTCQKYGTKGGKLVAHHIKNFSDFPELRFIIDNGITFSEKAHKEFHKKYGYKNNTKEQIKDFF